MAPTRREMIIATGTLAAAAAASPALAADEAGHAGHAHHHFGSTVNRALLTAMSAGVEAGQVCIQHCIQTMKTGDTTLADCLDVVQQMVATCTAAGELTALQSPYLKDMLKVSQRVCEACEAECRKHADMHAECKACAEACVACLKETRAAIAA